VEAARKAERAQDRARREKLKSISQLEKECRAIVQKIARIRDRNDGCISCHLPASWGGQWHGSHFRPAGNNSAVQFSLWNIHKSCSPCNAHKGGNLTAYEPRLAAKIGQEKVDWLKSQTQVVKWPREYLMRFKRVMGKRLRRMEARLCQ
jgi:malonyl CoA-acyl carrier protein transacylase